MRSGSYIGGGGAERGWRFRKRGDRKIKMFTKVSTWVIASQYALLNENRHLLFM